MVKAYRATEIITPAGGLNLEAPVAESPGGIHNLEVNVMPNARLTRSNTDRLLAGVCGGIAAYLGVDSTLVRLAFIVLLLASGIGLPMYLILWVIMPLATDVNKSGSTIVQDNIEEMGLQVAKGVNRLGRPGTVGVVLVALGSFFLLTQFGFNSSLLWPALFIGLGIYWLVRRNE